MYLWFDTIPGSYTGLVKRCVLAEECAYVWHCSSGLQRFGSPFVIGKGSQLRSLPFHTACLLVQYRLIKRSRYYRADDMVAVEKIGQRHISNLIAGSCLEMIVN